MLLLFWLPGYGNGTDYITTMKRLPIVSICRLLQRDKGGLSICNLDTRLSPISFLNYSHFVSLGVQILCFWILNYYFFFIFVSYSFCSFMRSSTKLISALRIWRPFSISHFSRKLCSLVVFFWVLFMYS